MDVNLFTELSYLTQHQSLQQQFDKKQREEWLKKNIERINNNGNN